VVRELPNEEWLGEILLSNVKKNNNKVDKWEKGIDLVRGTIFS
jgi:hypothetical protein